MTILEAMSAGMPVLASQVGGIPEAIDDSSGILVLNEISSVRNALITLINDPIRRVEMGGAAYTRAKELFSLERFLRETESVYQEAIRL